MSQPPPEPPLVQEEVPAPVDADDVKIAWNRLVVAATAVQDLELEAKELADDPGLVVARQRDAAEEDCSGGTDTDGEQPRIDAKPNANRDDEELRAELAMLSVGAKLVYPLPAAAQHPFCQTCVHPLSELR
jgi:hypothetical protein